MFVIVYNNSVTLGPMRWNRFRFENEIQEESGTSVTLPDRNDNLSPIIINDEIKILPVQGADAPAHNPKTQFLSGPFWEFTDTAAIMSYVPANYSIENVKVFLKEDVAAERWRKEHVGTTVNINGADYSFATDKSTRLILQNSLLIDSNINWKINRDVWLSLTSTDVQNIINSILTHVQSCFDWELSKIQEIDNCTTLEELDAVVISQPTQDGGML